MTCLCYSHRQAGGSDSSTVSSSSGTSSYMWLRVGSDVISTSVLPTAGTDPQMSVQCLEETTTFGTNPVAGLCGVSASFC